MKKIYCSECGAELDSSVNFCSNCGNPLDDENISSNSEDKIDNSSESKKLPISSNNKKKQDKLIVLGCFIGIIIICLLLVGISSLNQNAKNSVEEHPPEKLTPPFNDTIYGINFQIPEGYKVSSGTDNQNKHTMTTYDRTYSSSHGGTITISVSTPRLSSFYWDLSQNRDVSDKDKTINGHTGILKSSGEFLYVDGDKLVSIRGANEQQLQSIIIQ